MLDYVLRSMGLDQGEFTEGHELDRKWRVPEETLGEGYRRRRQSGCWRSWDEAMGPMAS